MSRSVRAVVIESHGHPPAVVERAAPAEPVAGHCLVAVRAAPIAPLDVLCVPGGSGVNATGGHPVAGALTAAVGPTTNIVTKNKADLAITAANTAATEGYKVSQLQNQQFFRDSLNKTETERLAEYKQAARDNLDQTLAANRAFEKRATGAVYGGASRAARAPGAAGAPG